MKNSQYFLHDCCARNNAKMLSLTADKGLEGYGAYWVLLEYLREQSDYCMPLSLLPSLAKQLGKFTQWVEEIVCNYGLFVLTNDGRFTSKGLQQRMKPLENKRKARDAKAEKAARKKAVNSNTNSSFSAAQKTETNEKNSAKNVENTPLQLVDNERVAKSSLEENSIVENSIDECMYQLGSEKITYTEYNELISKEPKEVVDEVIHRIIEHPYWNCLNKEVIVKWCSEARRTACARTRRY